MLPSFPPILCTTNLNGKYRTQRKETVQPCCKRDFVGGQEILIVSPDQSSSKRNPVESFFSGRLPIMDASDLLAESFGRFRIPHFAQDVNRSDDEIRLRSIENRTCVTVSGTWVCPDPNRCYGLLVGVCWTLFCRNGNWLDGVAKQCFLLYNRNPVGTCREARIV
jgi:hypothetical protein